MNKYKVNNKYKVLDVREFINGNYHIIIENLNNNKRLSFIFSSYDNIINCYKIINYEFLVKGDIVELETDKISYSKTFKIINKESEV